MNLGISGDNMGASMSVVCAGKTSAGCGPMERNKSFIGSIALLALSLLLTSTANGAVNVYLSTTAPAGLQNDFIANATNQYNASLKPGLLAGSWDIRLFGKNSTYTPPVVSTSIITLDAITRNLMAISTDTYVYGYANGMQRERYEDLTAVGGFAINCSSLTFYKNMDPRGPNFVTSIDSTTCNTVLGSLFAYINQKNYADPAPIPPWMP